MITKLIVESFKSLESVEVELGQVNVFIGANGSGKSNLLEALGVLGAAASGRVDDESLRRRGVRPGLPQLYKSSFHGEKEPAHIIFEARQNETSYRVSLSNPIDDPNPAWYFSTELLKRSTTDVAVERPLDRQLNREQGYAALKVVELRKGDSALTLFDDLRNYCIYSADTPTLRGLTPDQQSREPLGLSGGRLADAIRQIRSARTNNKRLKEKFQQVISLIDWANNVDSAASAWVQVSRSATASQRVVRFSDRYMAKGRHQMTAYDASEGALYVLFAAVLALHPKAPHLFAIDNLDQALNPRLSMRLAEALCRWLLESKHPRQVLLTVHNPTALDGLPLTDDRVRLFTVDRDNRGHTVVRRVELTENLLAKASEGWTLSRLWVNKLIGGVPNV